MGSRVDAWWRTAGAAVVGVVCAGLAALLPSLETRQPELALTLCAAAGGATAFAAYALPPSSRAGPAWAPPVAVTAGGLAYALALSNLSIIRHHRLSTGIKDLGIYDSIFWHNLRGEWLGASFVKSGVHTAAHVDPILIALSPVYLLGQRAETLLVLQSTWLATGAVPLYLLARAKLGSAWSAVAMAGVYLLYPPLHGTNLYDFHSLTLIAPLLLWAVYLLETGRTAAYAGVLALLLLCREDVALLGCGLGAWILATGKGWPTGLGTIAACIAWFAFVKLAIMPDPDVFMAASANTYSYASFYRDLIPEGGGAGALVTTVLTDPLKVARVVFTPAKGLFFAKLFVPVLFLPLFCARRGWVLLAYGFAFLFLASRKEVYSTNYQYPVILYPLALALVPVGLAELGRWRSVAALGLDPQRLARALVLGCLVTTALTSTRFGALAPNRALRPGNQRLHWDMSRAEVERYAWLDAAIATIPPDASVSATFRLGAHISNRRDAREFAQEKNADYLLVDTKDSGKKVKPRYEAMVKSKTYELASSHGTLELWKRKPKRGAR